jgi:hypothetical protein
MTNSSILENSVESSMVDSNGEMVSSQQLDNRLLQSIRLHYHSNHQAEYLNLQAQVESLLTQLQQGDGNS